LPVWLVPESSLRNCEIVQTALNCVQASDFDSASEYYDDSDINSSSCDWETEEEEVLSVNPNPNGRSVDQNPALCQSVLA